MLQHILYAKASNFILMCIYNKVVYLFFSLMYISALHGSQFSTGSISKWNSTEVCKDHRLHIIQPLRSQDSLNSSHGGRPILISQSETNFRGLWPFGW